MSIDVPSPGDPILDTWGVAVANAINHSLVDGPQPFALPMGQRPDGAVVGNYSLAVAEACLMPILLAAPLRLLRSTYHYGGPAGTLRTAEARLYRDADSPTLAYVDGTALAWSFTPGGAGNVTSADITPIELAPGLYWLVIRNTSATATNNISYSANSTLGYLHRRATGTAALGSTLDATAFTTQAAPPFLIALTGEVWGGLTL